MGLGSLTLDPVTRTWAGFDLMALPGLYRRAQMDAYRAGRQWLRTQQVQGFAVGGSNDGEVAAVEGRYVGDVQPFGEGDDGGIGGAGVEVGLLAHQVCHPGGVDFGQLGEQQCAVG